MGRAAGGVWAVVVLLAIVIAVMSRLDADGHALPAEPVVPMPLTREGLRESVFGTSTLPADVPRVQRRWRDDRFPYAERIDRLTVDLPHGFTSVAYELFPDRWNGRTMIFHGGHTQRLDASPLALRWFVRRGWRVVAMAMPLSGLNAHPGFRHAPGNHDELARLDHPLGLFLMPVVAVVNYTRAGVMVGLSGGGWTTAVAAAIDTRIRDSYPVAGTIPWRWRNGDAADLEQRLIPSYLDLYRLAVDHGRRQLAPPPPHDPSCFAGRSSDEWASAVGGDFGALVDLRSRQHAITQFHLRAITKDLAAHQNSSFA